MNDHEYKVPEDVKIRPKNLTPFEDLEKKIRELKLDSGKKRELLEKLEESRREYEELHEAFLLGRKYPQLYTPAYLKEKLNNALNELAVQKGLRKGQLSMFKDNSIHSVVMIDLDDFKKVNDNYGHLVGDEVLNRVSDVINRIARKHDGMAAKYGGEEFQLWFRGKSVGEVRRISQELIDSIRDATRQPPVGVPVDKWEGVTASAGFATHNMIKREDRLTADVLTDLADKALLGAKAKGKNRVKAADEV